MSDRYTFDKAEKDLKVFEDANSYNYASVIPLQSVIDMIARLRKTYESGE